MMEVGERRKGEFGFEEITVLRRPVGKGRTKGTHSLPCSPGATIFKGTGMMG